MTRRLSLLVYWTARHLTRILVLLFARLEIVGVEHFPRTGPVVMVANHVHLLDPPLVAACAPRRVHPMAKRELFETPAIGWFFWAYGAFPVRRFSGDMGALRVARNYLREGEAVLMFPEGTRSRGNGMRAALPGAAMVALLSKAPVLPVAVQGTNIRIPAVFFQWMLRRRPRIRVEFGEPFHLEAAGTDGRTAEVATDRMMRRVAAMLPPEARGVYGEETAGTIVVARQRENGRPRGP
jgi:1-acyl-sn-glycerol-3-phosphate acyltransferase